MPLLGLSAIYRLFRTQLCMALFALGFVYAPASSATFIDVPGSTLNGNELTGDFSQDGELDFDTRFTSLSPMIMRVEIGDSDGAEIAFSGFHLNDSGVPWRQLRIGLVGGPSFTAANQVLPDSGGAAAVALTSMLATIDFSSLESLGVTLGEPGDTIDLGQDWSISLNGLGTGDAFTIVLAAVPVPGSLLLFIAGLVGWAASRRVRALAAD